MIKNVKPEMNLAIQLLMCSVSTCESYPLFHFVSYISNIDILGRHFFTGKTCLFVASTSAR